MTLWAKPEAQITHLKYLYTGCLINFHLILQNHPLKLKLEETFQLRVTKLGDISTIQQKNLLKSRQDE